MRQGILFEFDGVLADTAVLRRSALAAAFAAEGIPVAAHVLDEAVADASVPSAVRRALTTHGVADETLADLIVARADDRYRESLARELTLAPGVHAAVRSLQSTARLAVVTRARRDDVTRALALAQLDDAFTFVIAAEDARPPKPAPAPYHAALARLTRHGIPPGGVLALEDGLVGIRSAHAAGIRCLVVGTIPAHVALEADGVLASLDGVTAEGLDRLALRRAERVP